MHKVVKFTITSLLCLLTVFVSASPALAAGPPETDAAAVLLVEGVSGTVLFSENKDVRRSPDTLVKIMTLLLAVEACDSGAVSRQDVVTAADSAFFDITEQSSNQKITPGEDLTFIDLMYCAFLGSANEACNIIAEHVSGSVGAFVNEMNLRAASLGCKDTLFTNTHGQVDAGQYTTAWELYLIYSAAMENPGFAEISRALQYKTSATNKSDVRSLTNTNYLLSENSRYYYKLCTGGKPSATYENGYAFVGSSEYENMQLFSVLLGTKAITLEDNSTLMRNLSDARALMAWGFESFEWKTILSDGELITKIPVKHGDGADFVNLRPVDSITILTPVNTDRSDFERVIRLFPEERGEELVAPVKSGDVLGEITLKKDGKSYGTVKLVANTDVKLLHIKYIESRVLEVLSSRIVKIIIMAIIVLFAGYIFLLVRYNRHRRAKRKRIEEAKAKIIEDRRRTEHSEKF